MEPEMNRAICAEYKKKHTRTDRHIPRFHVFVDVGVKRTVGATVAVVPVPLYTTVELLTPTQKVSLLLTNVALKKKIHYKSH